MMGSFLSRIFIMILGYAYPAYECYKTVELNKPKIEKLRFWCQYWILVALLTVFERIGDAFISWLPMYCEAKLAFFIYLWYPKTKGTAYVYDSFFRPFVAKHETEIDHTLLELRTRAGDVVVLYWQKAIIYGQSRFFEVLQYVASQSKSEPQSRRANPDQQQHVNQTTTLEQQQHVNQTTTLEQQQPLQQTPAPSTLAKSQQQELTMPRNGTSPPKPPKPPVSTPVDTKTVANSTKKTQAMKADTVSAPAKTEESNAPRKETVLDEATRKTRGRLRKRPAIGVPSTTH